MSDWPPPEITPSMRLRVYAITDPHDWAAAFMKTAVDRRREYPPETQIVAVDEETMRSWFADAMATAVMVDRQQRESWGSE